MAWPQAKQKEAHPGHSMENFVKRLASSETITSVARLCGKEQVLWQLGLTCPVEYVNGGPILPEYLPDEVAEIISDLQKLNHDFDFHLWFDGIEVRKPILLPTPKVKTTYVDDLDSGLDEDVKVWPIDITGKAVSGTPVHAKGYLVFQPHRVAPIEIRGLYPRLHGVGVGSTYDQSGLIRQLKGENPVIRVQVSGELYIDKGLDGALNLDRSGFMEIDPEFRLLADEVHKIVARDDNSFVRQARKARVERQRRREALVEEQRSTERESALERKLKIAKVPYRVKKAEPAALRELSELRTPRTIAYPARGTPRVVIDRSREQIHIDAEVKDPQVIAIIALVDRLLGDAKDPEKSRKEFAEALSEILRDE